METKGSVDKARNFFLRAFGAWALTSYSPDSKNATALPEIGQIKGKSDIESDGKSDISKSGSVIVRHAMLVGWHPLRRVSFAGSAACPTS